MISLIGELCGIAPCPTIGGRDPPHPASNAEAAPKLRARRLKSKRFMAFAPYMDESGA
jgi:hypothetical protein